MVNLRTAMNRGAFDFVTKPVDLNDLEITIRKTLEDIDKLRALEHRRAAAERARANLARYFSPNIVALLAERDEPFGAVRRQTVAVLFVDIVGFTQMAEGIAPEAVVTMLRQFHERMTAQIFACGGTVEKYIGDAIFAFWGLPHAHEDDAANALRCADAMIAALAVWNGERAAAGRGAARDRHRPPFGAGGHRRCRQRAKHFLHRDRRYGEHGKPSPGPDAQLRDATRRQRHAGRRGQIVSKGRRRAPVRRPERSRRSGAARPQRGGSHLDQAGPGRLTSEREPRICRASFDFASDARSAQHEAKILPHPERSP